ncbi:MAG: ATP-dependent 6-phosphofructokinase [Candidatus Hinthialibacter antarcticus]|nr:ATP-dependent 6-phosphofructokinase [Candidatus Hinthialibacter antarcticus]
MSDCHDVDFTISRLGKARFPSPLELSHVDGDFISNFVEDDERILFDNTLNALKQYKSEKCEPPSFEAAGPRDKIFFNPPSVKAAIVTCGGLCPGLNDVIRGIVLSLNYHYGVHEVYGIQYGYKGLVERSMLPPIHLTPKVVEDIPSRGGTFLGSSRGPQDAAEMVDFMVKNGFNMLFTIGGDGTQRGSLAVRDEVKKRGLEISVIGIPKTIDNDVRFVEKSFGFETAYSKGADVLGCAHVEATGAENGIAIVKLMGRQSGFLAATAALASGEANFVLIPEVPFDLDPPDGFLPALEERILRRKHAVVVVAEGAGQKLMDQQAEKEKQDASGNVKLKDIGVFLKEEVKKYFTKREIPVSIKYIDPSYIVRSLPATPSDSMYCLQLAHNAVHAAMSGRTGMLVGHWHSAFTHVPIEAAVSERKMLDTEGDLWLSVLQTSDQPRRMFNIG